MEDVGDAAVNAFEENVLFFKDCQLNRDFNNIHLAWLHDVSLIINHLYATLPFGPLSSPDLTPMLVRRDKAWPNVLDFCHRLSPIFGHVSWIPIMGSRALKCWAGVRQHVSNTRWLTDCTSAHR